MMPPKTASKPKFISIEGNIGSGKSTILKIIRENFPQLTILDQPLAEWQHIGEEGKINLLQLYYHKPQRWGFTFQIYAFMSRLKKWINYSQEEGQGLRISQRSLLSDRYIFASIMRDLNILDQAEHQIYLQFYNNLIQMNDVVNLYGVIYVQCPPQICQSRIKSRHREGEDEISIDYLQKIHEKHEVWLNKAHDKNYALVIDNTQPIQKNNLIKLLSQWIYGKQKAAEGQRERTVQIQNQVVTGEVL